MSRYPAYGYRALALLTLVVAALLGGLAWWWPNRPQLADMAMPGGKIASVSFAAFRDEQSPLNHHFPTEAQTEADLALIAPRVRAIRTYASSEGGFPIAPLAQKYGLGLWQGAWLGSNAATNERELKALIEAANRYPGTINRVIVGNEVLLRRDLPVEKLAEALDRVKAAVRQPVTYADVWEFWARNPQLARHVDIVTIHLLPYWEDEPANVEVALAHVKEAYARIKALFPDKPVAIGEVGWPSMGRWREDSAPSRVNQARFLRAVTAWAQSEGVDYNWIEAFDQRWKYKNEGTVGAAWGLWTTDRAEKFPLTGAVVEMPDWPRYAVAGGLLGLVLFGLTVWYFPAAMGVRLALLSMALGHALAFAWSGGVPYALDEYLGLALAGNLLGQAGLAALMLRWTGLRLSGLAVEPLRNGAQATRNLRAMLRLGLDWRRWRDFALDDLAFLFLWTAMALQAMLLFDPRYRDFPVPTFAVPLVVVLARWAMGGLPRGTGGWAELWAGGALAAMALISAVREHVVNLEAMTWTVCALLLAAPSLWRCLPVPATTRRAVQPAAEMGAAD
ncbi:glycoside hydrolase [Acetobacteraceae bacterium H6797]|nr:glycoside hydrolase [Acetobacteraceae bacterium H6797]